MTSITSISNQYSKMSFGSDDAPQEKSAIDAAFEENPMLSSMGITPELIAKTALLTPPLMMCDKFVNSKMGGEESKSWIKKIAEFGDKISYKINSNGKAGEELLKSLKDNRFTKYFFGEYAANPRNTLFVKPLLQPEAHVPGDLANNLKNLQEKDEYKKVFASLKPETQKYLSTINPANAAKEVKQLIAATDDLIKHGIDKVPDSGILPGDKKLSYFNNKLKAANSQMSKTMLGSMFTKRMLDLKNLLTFGGGLGGSVFVSFELNHAYKEASEAPEGEKLSTFMHAISEGFLGFVAMTVGANALYNIAGNKYRGMSKEARDEVENIVTSVYKDRNITKEGIKIAELKRDLLFKGASVEDVRKLDGKSLNEAKQLAQTLGKNAKLDLKLWEKPIKFLGRFLGTGLDEIQQAKYWNLPVVGEVKRPQLTLKGTGGGILRLAVTMGVILPLLQKPITKVTHAIFGEPTEFLKKEKERENGINTDNNEQNETVNATETQTPQIKEETNLLKKWGNLPAKTEKDNKAIAATKIQHNNSENELYVPSIQVDNSYLQIRDNELNQRADEILRKTDATINRINQTLK